MRTFTILLLSILLFGCNENEKDTSLDQLEGSRKNIQDSLAFELCEMYGLDQGIREPEIFSLLGLKSRNIDTHSFKRLLVFVREHGYPNKELIGEENWKNECVAMAAMAIMLHNPYRLVNEKEYFDLFLNEVEKGNMDREFLATVLDKHYWSKSAEVKKFFTALRLENLA